MVLHKIIWWTRFTKYVPSSRNFSTGKTREWLSLNFDETHDHWSWLDFLGSIWFENNYPGSSTIWDRSVLGINFLYICTPVYTISFYRDDVSLMNDEGAVAKQVDWTVSNAARLLQQNGHRSTKWNRKNTARRLYICFASFSGQNENCCVSRWPYVCFCNFSNSDMPFYNDF